MRRTPRWIVVWVLWVAATTAPFDARADPSADAGGFFAQGVRQFASGEWQAGLESFERANRLYPHPTTRFYIGRCYAALGRCDAALPLLRGAQNNILPRAEPDRAKDEAKCVLQIAETLLHSGKCAQARDELNQIKLPGLPDEVKDKHDKLLTKVRLCLPGQAAERVDDARFDPGYGVQDKTNSSDPSWQKIAGWVTFGSGLALLGGATYGVVAYASDLDAVDGAVDDYNQPGASAEQRAKARKEAIAYRDDAIAHSTLAWALGGAALAAVGTGVVLLVLDAQDESDTAAARSSKVGSTAEPRVGPGYVGFSVRF